MTLKEMLVVVRKEIDSDIVRTQQQINELFNDLNKLLAIRDKLDNSINDLKL